MRSEEFPQARKPAYKLWSNFGESRVRQSSAQVTTLDTPGDLVGRQMYALSDQGSLGLPDGPGCGRYPSGCTTRVDPPVAPVGFAAASQRPWGSCCTLATAPISMVSVKVSPSASSSARSGR